MSPEAALAAVLTRYYDCVPPSEAEDDAAAILAAMPDWTLVPKDDYRDGRQERDALMNLIESGGSEIERLQEQIARQALASPELAAAFDAVRRAE